MKNITLTFLIAMISGIMLLTGCEIIGDILEFGIWIGVILVVLVIAIVWWIVRKIGGK